MKTNYLRKFENFKNTLEKQLKDEYESKKKELAKEIDEMKAKIYRQKCSEKLKLQKINQIKKTLNDKEKKQFENAEKIEKVLSQTQTQIQNNTNSKSFITDKNNQTQIKNLRKISEENININSKREEILQQDSYNYDNNINRPDIYEINNSINSPLSINSGNNLNNNAVNIFEIK